METFFDKKMERNETISLRIRAAGIPNKDLPANYAEITSELFPTWNKQKIRNVKNAIAVDKDITDILECMSRKFVKLKNELKQEFENKVENVTAA